MSLVLPVIAVVFDLLVPIGLLSWLLLSRGGSRIFLASIVLLTAVYLAVLPRHLVGFWHYVGAFWPFVYAASFAAILPHVARLPGAVASGDAPLALSSPLRGGQF